nr:kallikrein-10-like [Dasypus novemcinctus]
MGSEECSRGPSDGNYSEACQGIADPPTSITEHILKLSPCSGSLAEDSESQETLKLSNYLIGKTSAMCLPIACVGEEEELQKIGDKRFLGRWWPNGTLQHFETVFTPENLNLKADPFLGMNLLPNSRSFLRLPHPAASPSFHLSLTPPPIPAAPGAAAPRGPASTPNPAPALPALTLFLSPAAEAALIPKNDTTWDVAASGAPCARGSQPWHVSLFNGLAFHCAGVLVDESWVLTAAQCWNNKSLWARVGDDHLLLLQGEQLRRAIRSVRHPRYRPGSGRLLPRRRHEHDLMLLKLARPAVPGPRVQGLRLPDRCARPGDQYQAAGWGTMATRRVKYNKGLSCSQVSILSPKECEGFYPGVVTNNMMCAGMDQGHDPCQSDSGAPLVCDGTLQGIVSFGAYPCGSAQHPVVYTEVCKYVPWIKKTMHSN